jgi:hypothetical protein
MAAMVTVGALVLGLGACGGDDGAPASSALLEPVVTVAPDIEVPMGAEIRTSAGEAVFLPMTRDGRDAQPVAAYGDDFLLAESRASGPTGVEPQRFVQWDPDSGEDQPAWESIPGRQDIVAGVDGESVVYVRTGLALPFADWSLEVRDLKTGVTKALAAGQPAVLQAVGVTVAPPFGVAPRPAVRDGKVAWEEYAVVDGRAVRKVRVHDLTSGSTETIAIADSAAGENLTSVSLGGTRVAWVRRMQEGVSRIEVRNLEEGEAKALDLDAAPFLIALDSEGTTVAWDDVRGGKFAASLDGGDPVQIAGDEGWGVTASGQRFAWAPAAAYGGTGGYYDLETNELRLLGKKPGVQVNQATVMGDWFVWQELVVSEDGQADLGASGYYFLPIGR